MKRGEEWLVVHLGRSLEYFQSEDGQIVSMTNIASAATNRHQPRHGRQDDTLCDRKHCRSSHATGLVDHDSDELRTPADLF